MYYLLAACCLLCTTSAAVANIYVWEGIAAHCTLDHDNNTITINEAGTYGFRAFDPNDPNDPNDVLSIQDIDVDPNVAGDVTVTIAWDQYGGNGAADLWTGDLTHATYHVYLAGLEIAGSLATTGAFTCEDVTGDISVGGSMATGGDIVDAVTTASWSSTSSLLAAGGAARTGLMAEKLRCRACPRVSVLG